MPYPSLYRAKAVSIQSSAITAYVPQVFGETTITITDALGALPTEPTMGWVFFQAGNPEFPVWSAGVSAIGGGGAVGGGTDEVWIGPETPTGKQELWFDTDAGTDGILKVKLTAPDGSFTWQNVTSGGGGAGGAEEVFVGPSDPGVGFELWYDTDAGPVGGLEASSFVGEIKIWPGDTPPANWMFCLGQPVSRTTYSVLFGVLGTKFGVGDGSTTFLLPDFQGYAPVGRWPGGTYATGVGEYGGDENQTVTTHSHSVNITSGNPSANHTHRVDLWSGYVSADHVHHTSGTTDADDRGHQHYYRTASEGASGGSYGGYLVWPDGQLGGEYGAVWGSGGNTGHLHNWGNWSGGISANHQHATNGDSGTVSAWHTHDTNGNTGNTGSSGLLKNLPPYVTVNYIIRAI